MTIPLPIPIMPNTYRPTTTLIPEGGEEYMFKRIVDLYFKKNRVLNFINSLNFEYLDIDEWHIVANDIDWLIIKNKVDNTRIELHTFDSSYMLEVKYMNSSDILFYINIKEYFRLRHIIEVKIETKKMDKLYEELFKDEFAELEIDNTTLNLSKNRYGMAHSIIENTKRRKII